MANIESVSPGDVVVCRCQAREYNTRETMDSAFFRGDLSSMWTEFLNRQAAADRATELDLDLDEDAFDAAAEAFRYDHDLITAEETEQWLAARALDLDDFSAYLDRLCWSRSKEAAAIAKRTGYFSASAELRDIFTVDLILSDQLRQLTTQLSWRLAALCADNNVPAESAAAEIQRFLDRTQIHPDQIGNVLEHLGRDEEWLNDQVAMEAAFRRERETLIAPKTLSRELASLRLPLTRFDTEVIQVESRDAAQEALLCVREDGMSLEEVASEGRYPYRHSDFLLEDLEAEGQQRFLSAKSGQLMEPFSRGDGFEVCRVIRRVEPEPNDPAIQSRIENRAIARHFSELVRKYVTLSFVESNE